jgi:hypothetical protein
MYNGPKDEVDEEEEELFRELVDNNRYYDEDWGHTVNDPNKEIDEGEPE